MKLLLRNLIAIYIVVIILASAIVPSTMGDESLPNEQELVLLQGEHFFVLNASDNVYKDFQFRFAFPPDYGYQIPIMMEIHEDTTADIKNYRIEEDSDSLNKILNFTLGPMMKDDSVLLHFSYWVLVKNHEFKDLPCEVDIPKKRDLPEETKTWLSSSEVVQAKRILIRLKARQLRGFTDDLFTLADRIAKYSKYHRYVLFLLQLNLGLYRSQDAITTLFFNGECAGRSHLGCALFRANKVPARVILSTPNYTFWYQIHYMMEYYCPGYGWILTEVHEGIQPYEPKHQIIMRICYPEDENDTGTSDFFPRMTGIEKWFWIDNSNISPYYQDFVEGSKTNMFPRANVTTDTFTADYAFLLTQMVYHLYEQYTGMTLFGENLDRYENAINYQTQAITELQESDVYGYLDQMSLAYDEYLQITL